MVALYAKMPFDKNDKTWMCVIFRIYSDPSSNTNKNMISSQKKNSCLSENNSNVLGIDEANVNNQMGRKYKKENIRSYLKRFCSFSGFDIDTEGEIQSFDV